LFFGFCGTTRILKLFVIALTGLIILALLALLVVGLHRYQLSVAQHNADKYNPLPPLKNATLSRNLPDLPFDALDDQPVTRAGEAVTSAPGDGQDRSVEGASDLGQTLDPVEQSPHHDDNGDAPGRSAASKPTSTVRPGEEEDTASPVEPEQIPVETTPAESPTDAESWQERIAELKKQDRFDEALQICRQEYPLWSAYQQASLIHRARIKQLSQANRDISDELASLYQLAAEASFLHDRVRGLPNISLAQLKLLDLAWISDLEMPYQQIGYTELRLIKKTDIKLLLEKWGRPQAHRRPRELHPDAWQRLCGGSQSTLF
jgi:hypothetical protein